MSTQEKLAAIGQTTDGPWTACLDGKCQCKFVSCGDHPIAKIESGEWGDEYPAIRLVGVSSLDYKAEAYMERIPYGGIDPEIAAANARLIALAPALRRFAERVLELHQHRPNSMYQNLSGHCSHCKNDRGNAEAWPCPTVQAAMEELGK